MSYKKSLLYSNEYIYNLLSNLLMDSLLIDMLYKDTLSRKSYGYDKKDKIIVRA